MPTGLDYFWEELAILHLTVTTEVDSLSADPLYRSPVTASEYLKMGLFDRAKYIKKRFSREQIAFVLNARAPHLRRIEKNTIAHELLTWQLEPLYIAYKAKV